MHSLEICSIRVHDENLAGPRAERYSDMCNIRGYSIVAIVNEALTSKGGDYLDLREYIQETNPNKDINKIPRKLSKIKSLSVNGGDISGIIQLGEYGQKADIVDRISKSRVGHIEKDHSPVHDHFFHLNVQSGAKRAILLVQAINGNGAKSIFELFTKDHFKKKTGGLSFQIRPLAYKTLVEKWMKEAEICEIRLSRFTKETPASDIADMLNEAYAEVLIKPNTRNGRLGRLADLDAKYIDILKGQANSVKVQVEFDGRKRLFKLDSQEAPVSSVELLEEDSSLVFENGNPTLSSISNFSKGLVDELWSFND